MSRFDSGVAEYIHAKATVDVYFPVDRRGNADVSCSACYLYRLSSRYCALTGEVIPYPDKYVGGQCPLIPANEFDKGETE